MCDPGRTVPLRYYGDFYRAVSISEIALRDRPRLSVIYVQNVNAVLSSALLDAILASLERYILKAANNVQLRMTQNLQARLQLLLNDSGCRKLTNPHWQAITRCDLWGRPMVFADEHIPDMIAEVFAVMKTIGRVDPSYLAENITVAAALQVFSETMTGSPSRVDRGLLQLMVLHQDDLSMYIR